MAQVSAQGSDIEGKTGSKVMEGWHMSYGELTGVGGDAQEAMCTEGQALCRVHMGGLGRA